MPFSTFNRQIGFVPVCFCFNLTIVINILHPRAAIITYFHFSLNDLEYTLRLQVYQFPNNRQLYNCGKVLLSPSVVASAPNYE